MRPTGNSAHCLEWLALGLRAIMKYAKVRVADQNVRLPFWHMLRDFLYDKRIPDHKPHHLRRCELRFLV